MYKKNIQYTKTTLRVNEAIEGETIEQKVERVTINKEPIKDGAPLIYTERKDGVQAGYDIRTDRFDVAIDAMDYVARSVQAKRDNNAKMKIVKEDSEAEPTQGTEGTNE